MGSAMLGKRAVVVGGGMGGMQAAQVLSRHFDHVTILDKDVMPTEAEPRIGAPQGAHAHVLLVQGRRNLEALFPGFTSEMLDRGAVVVRMGLDDRLYDQGWMPHRDLGLSMLTMSRPLLEGAVRDLLAGNPKVTTRQDVKATGWCFDGDRVTGVIVESEAGAETIEADFVIDASGRSSESQRWLEAGGFGPVPETVINIGAGYATAIFEKPADWAAIHKTLLVGNPPPNSRGAFCFSLEKNRFICSMTGRFDDTPSGKEDDFYERAKSLCQPDVYEWVTSATRITPIRIYRAPLSRWRRFETMDRFPRGLLPLGDAVAHVNPFRGQGMTLTSEHVRNLGEVLAQADAGTLNQPMHQAYFARIHDFTKMVWEGLETLEYAYPQVEGERPADLAQRLAFGQALRQLFETDAEAHKLAISISNLTRPSSDMATSGVVDRVIALMQAQAKPPAAVVV
jgi:2-polyprenyl-6-methoxyphenol hydroxylase-like FAD-dependent oxidoreductase